MTLKVIGVRDDGMRLVMMTDDTECAVMLPADGTRGRATIVGSAIARGNWQEVSEPLPDADYDLVVSLIVPWCAKYRKNNPQPS